MLLTFAEDFLVISAPSAPIEHVLLYLTIFLAVRGTEKNLEREVLV